ncbi:MAG: hypothetical protein C4549_06675 [Deltaproteobacteria bacterium]|nr:MAG: hypothetical protein C4549_06675 [Deltaproteobacteria bacterium]
MSKYILRVDQSLDILMQKFVYLLKVFEQGVHFFDIDKAWPRTGVQVRTPHSSEFKRLVSGAFYFAILVYKK